MKTKHFMALVGGVVLLLLLLLSLYVVPAGERFLVLRLGKLERDTAGNPVIIQPGLHIKWPFVNTVRRFDIRLQDLNVDSSKVITTEKKYVLVDYYALWKIEDLTLYFKRTGGVLARSQLLLQQKINEALRASFGKHTIQEAVSVERGQLMRDLQKITNKSAHSLGIQVVDVRIRGIELPHETLNSVFRRMQAQRHQVATKLRSEGRADSAAILAQADSTARILVAEAGLKGEKLRADGDQEASEIYRVAYRQDPSFYAFYQSLQAYKKAFEANHSIMVLKPDGDFFKYFNPSHVTDS